MGVLGDRLKLQIAAPPVDGKANEAVREFLADLLGVPKSRVSIAAGETASQKTIHIDGIEESHAARCLGGAA